jgi:hypothetical protein
MMQPRRAFTPAGFFYCGLVASIGFVSTMLQIADEAMTSCCCFIGGVVFDPLSFVGPECSLYIGEADYFVQYLQLFNKYPPFEINPVCSYAKYVFSYSYIV